MTRKRSAGIAAAIVLAIILALRLIMASRHFPAPASSQPLRAVGTQRPATFPGQIKVGVYLSKPYSVQMTSELSSRQLDVVPLLEPGSESEPQVIKLLNVYFKGKTALDVTDADALKKLDVIVAPRIWSLPDDARAAIEIAVTNGTGLLARNGLGCMEPGSGDEVSRLSGFEESQFGYNDHPMECEVIAAHPILGKLSAQIGQPLMITPNGTWGAPNPKATPLIKVKDMDAFRNFWQQGNSEWTFYPLYVGELGKGRIIGCQFPAWEPMPKGLMSATDNEFNLRAVLWLARRLDSAQEVK